MQVLMHYIYITFILFLPLKRVALLFNNSLIILEIIAMEIDRDFVEIIELKLHNLLAIT